MKTTKINPSTSRLRNYRLAAGLKQVELAAHAGVGIATLNKAEKWGFPLSPPVAERLAKVLGCKPDEIMGR